MLEIKDYCWSSWKMEKIREQIEICPSLLIPMVVLERKRKKVHTGPTPGTLRRPEQSIHPASRGVAAHTAGLFWSVTGAKGGVDHEDQISKE